MKVCAVITGAGKATRMGGRINKHMLKLKGKPCIAYVIETYDKCKLIDEIILTAEPDQIKVYEKMISDFGFKKVNKIIRGGKELQDSAYNGLKEIKNCDIVIFQDGARPLVTEDMIKDVVESTKKYGAAVTGFPAKDTTKIIDDESFVIKTPDRKTLWAVQTPQAIEYHLALKAFEKAYKDGYYGTDYGMLVERLEKKVKVVRGSYDNIKLTTPEDVDILEKLIEMRIEKRW